MLGSRSLPWLLPALPLLARSLGRIYYRVRFEGMRAPARGPVLFVANHPNALFDAVFVAAAVGRPVRFLAKAPLFHDPLAGYLVRGAGAIPVYRRMDDPAQLHKNSEMFGAAHRALCAGSALAMLPEGRSHGGSRLLPLRSGAARIVLAAARASSFAVPIVPIGIELEHKQTFRSRAVVRVGAPIEWSDLLERRDGRVVEELLSRIERALQELARGDGRGFEPPRPAAGSRRWLSACCTAAAFSLFGVPYCLTGRLARLRRPVREHASTDKLLLGLIVYAAWICGLALAVGVGASGGGPAAVVVGVATLVSLPALGYALLRCAERLRAAIDRPVAV